MSAKEPRRLGYYSNAHWFQGAVVLVILGGLALWLLNALEDAKEAVERQNVELSIRQIRTGLQLAKGLELIQQRKINVAAWVGMNPIDWMAAPPRGYHGECPAQEARDLLIDEWCFDVRSRELLYRPRHAEHLSRVGAGVLGEMPCEYLRWHVVRVNEGDFADVRFEAANNCRWALPTD